MNHKRIQALRARAFQLQNCLCYYCGLPMWEKDCESFRRDQGLTPKQAQFLKSTAEHLKARQDGGRDSCSNIAAACHYCNQKRHAGRSKCAPDSASYKRVIQKKVSKGKWHPLAHTLKLQRIGNQQETPVWRH